MLPNYSRAIVEWSNQIILAKVSLFVPLDIECSYFDIQKVSVSKLFADNTVHCVFGAPRVVFRTFEVEKQQPHRFPTSGSSELLSPEILDGGRLEPFPITCRIDPF